MSQDCPKESIMQLIHGLKSAIGSFSEPRSNWERKRAPCRLLSCVNIRNDRHGPIERFRGTDCGSLDLRNILNCWSYQPDESCATTPTVCGGALTYLFVFCQVSSKLRLRTCHSTSAGTLSLGKGRLLYWLCSFMWKSDD